MGYMKVYRFDAGSKPAEHLCSAALQREVTLADLNREVNLIFEARQTKRFHTASSNIGL